MSIENRLKQDAVRFSRMQPPPDLRARLQASLDAVPPIDISSARAPRPVRKWFSPAIAVLTLCMMLVFVSALPMGFGTFTEQPGILGDITPNDSGEGTGITSSPQQDKNSYDQANIRVLPLDRIGMFAALALVTGFLCATELKGRPRLLVPALVALTLFFTVALIYIFGKL